MTLKSTGVRSLALALLVGSALLGGTGVAVAGGSPSLPGQPTYSAPPYAPAAYATQWTISQGTPTRTIAVHGGAAGRIWQVLQFTNVGTAPLSRAILTVQVVGVEVDNSWNYSGPNLGLVQLLNSNGVFTNTGAGVQDLGTIDPGSYSDHVLNMRYASSVQELQVSLWVWYLP